MKIKILIALCLALTPYCSQAMLGVLQPTNGDHNHQLIAVKDEKGLVVGYYKYDDNKNPLDWEPVINVYNKKSEFMVAIPTLNNTESTAKKQLRKAGVSEILIKRLLPILSKIFDNARND